MRIRAVRGWARIASSVTMLLLLSLSGFQAVEAQQLEPVSASIDTRDHEYEQLAEEVAWLEQKGNLLKKVVRLVTPTVVHIEAEKAASQNTRLSHKPVEEAGSGVLIRHDERFFVLTNRHVIRDSYLSQIKVKLSDGRILHPSKVWSDRGTDVAVMAVGGSGLIPARLGDSDRLEIGDFVVAVGSPFGLNHSVTFGIISAKGRRDLKLGDGSVKYQNFLQTDAAINPGNSGGPLLNLRGEVIGLNTAIASSSGGSEGIGFAIPIKMVVSIAHQLIEQGFVKRAYLGVRLDSGFTADEASERGLPRPSGALISGVTSQSPAAASGFNVGDVILQFDGVSIEDDAHLVNLVSVTPVGEDVEVLIYRDGSPLRKQVTVGDRSDFESQ